MEMIFIYTRSTYYNDGRYFYQTANLPDSIDGAYTFKTSDNKYHLLSYMISHPFTNNQEFQVGCMFLNISLYRSAFNY